VSLCALLALFHARNGQSQNAPPTLDQYLRTIGLGARDLETAVSGRPVTKLLSVASDNDLAVFGMIGVRASQESVVTHLLDLDQLLAANGRRFHIFHDPPTLADVREAAFSESGYRELRDCRPGHCAFKLPAAAMEVFVRQIDWSAPDVKAQVDQRMRHDLLELVADYTRRGNGATLPYDDVHGVRPGDVFVQLSAQAPEFYDYAPDLKRFLTTYPSGRPEGVRDYLYWAEDRTSQLRPTFTLNHLAVYVPPAGEASGTVLIATKQVYASHYFEGAFGLLGIVRANPAGKEGITYLLIARRARLDRLPSNLRGRARAQLTGAARADLERYRSLLEPRTPKP
jgi:hypothetical protein